MSETPAETPGFGHEAGEPEWFCDQCGLRYYGPGVCQNGHAPADLQKIADVEAAEQGADPTVTDSPQSASSGDGEGDADPVAGEEPSAPAPEPHTEPAVPETTAPSGEPPDVPSLSPVQEAKSLLGRALDILHSIG